MSRAQKSILTPAKKFPSAVTPRERTEKNRLGSGSNRRSGGLLVLHANGGLHTNTLLGKEVNQQGAGAAVPRRLEHGLAVLVLLHALKVDVEEIRGVQRTTLGLRMELSAENRARLVDHSFVATVVEVDEVWLPLTGQGRHINSITVVLAGDVAATSGQVQGGDVVGTVSVLQLDSSGTGCESQQLVAKTDTHDGDLRGLHELAEMVDSLLAMGWVTGSIGDEYSIEVVGYLVNRVVKREYRNASSTVDQATEDVLLDTAVDHSNVTLGVRSTDVERSLSADLTDEVDLLRVDKRFVLVGVVLLTHRDTGQGGTPLTEVGNNSTGVNARDGRNTLAGAPLTKALHSGPVAVLLCNIGDDYTGRLEVGGLKVLKESIGVLLSRRDTVVANQWLGEDQNLATVRGIRQRLGISHQGGGEDGFTGDVGLGTEGLSMENGTISDRERRAVV